jgi:hypothetical protein
MKYVATWPMGMGNLVQFDEGYVLHVDGDLDQAKYIRNDGGAADEELAARLRRACTPGLSTTEEWKAREHT